MSNVAFWQSESVTPIDVEIKKNFVYGLFLSPLVLLLDGLLWHKRERSFLLSFTSGYGIICVNEVISLAYIK